jgi:biopolymer transport protein ExbB/TolQ
VSNKNTRESLLAVLSNLGWPLLWGTAEFVLFYALVLRGPLKSEFTLRYFAGHPVSFASTFLFLVGLSSLVRLAMTVGLEFFSINRIKLEAPPTRGQSIAACDMLLDQLDELPSRLRDTYLGRRLQEALDIVQRKKSAEGLDEELKFLADVDAGRQQDGYSLARITIWAIPMFGFLGTVLGLTQCLQGFDAKQIATDMSAAMQGQLGGLYVKFATSAQSLSMSIVLMFIQFLIERFETQLLSVVNSRASDELVGRFAETGNYSSPQLHTMQQMCEVVIKHSEQLLTRQTQLWQATIEAAHDHWSKLVEGSSQQVQTALHKSLDTSLSNHIQQWQSTLNQNAQLIQSQQSEMAKQSELLLRTVEATGEVTKLEHVLNANLQSLAGAKKFEDTVMSLSAAIHLLTTRLTPADASTKVTLSRAA